MSVKGFKLNDGTVVKYDYSALDDITVDTTLAITGVVADAKTVGDEINSISNSVSTLSGTVGDTTNLETTNKTSIVSSINEVNGNQPFVIKNIEVSTTIAQGSNASPSSTEINLSSYAPTGKTLYNAIVSVESFVLPYIGPSVATYTYVNRIASNKITIFNGGATWNGTQTVYIIAFFK